MKFTPGDFKDNDFYLQDNMYLEAFVDVANAKLEQWLKEAPVVYLNRKYTSPKVHAKYWTEYENDLTLDGPTTHQAKLVCIEEIK